MASLKKVLTSNLTNGAYTSEVVNQSLRPDSVCLIYVCASDGLAASWGTFAAGETPSITVEARADASAPWVSLGSSSLTTSAGYAGITLVSYKCHPFMRIKVNRDESSGKPIDIWMGSNS